jgi:hypothetical protein
MNELGIIGTEVIDNGKMHLETFGIVDYNTNGLFVFCNFNGEDTITTIHLDNGFCGESAFHKMIENFKSITGLTA